MISAPGWAILEVEEKRKVGMIELPDSAVTETQVGTIVTYPEAKFYVEGGVIVGVPPFKVGDKVAFRKYHSSEIDFGDGKKYAAVHLENLIVKAE